jgi:hypothetical protein
VIRVLILGGILQVIPQQKFGNLVELTRHVPGHKAEAGEVLPPPSLLSQQALLGLEIFQVFVVCY